MKFCGVCGAQRLSLAEEELIHELDATLRQLERLHQSGALSEVTFRVLKTKIANEREQILFPAWAPRSGKAAIAVHAGHQETTAAQARWERESGDLALHHPFYF